MPVARRHFARLLFVLLLTACQSTPVEPEPPRPNAPATPRPAATSAPKPVVDTSVAWSGSTLATASGTMAAASASAMTTPSASPPSTAAAGAASAAATSTAGASAVRYVHPVATVPISPDDPLHGVFTLADATHGLPKAGVLTAVISTELGDLTCELYEDRAPITVANFVGLARGLRPFKTQQGEWVKKPGYDGTTFHRIIKGFMVQGGDPAGDGSGEPGYLLPDEVWVGAKHDTRGQLCMANRGADTNGMQFFVMDGVAAHLDRGYTIFGKCDGTATLDKLVAEKVVGDRALNPPKIKKVTIKRVPKKK